MTHEEQVIEKVGAFYVLHEMARIEAETLNTTIDELTSGVRDERALKLIETMYQYILFQKQLIEQLATTVRLQDHPINIPDFVPMSKPQRKLY
ncbi:MAG TPA: hypothetical protein VGN64_17005 [Dyadobacter sp.]|jgi:hypothetical protein|nr:hypothetical protein [Dyadobacter sp.]